MLRIGLTGGIASGKSSVAKILAEQGAIVLDADQIAHENMAPTGPAYSGIVAYFGSEILDSDGQINRPKLGAKVFQNPVALQQLNQLTHPLVRQVLLEKTQEFQAQEATREQNWLLILMIPLLFESDLAHLVDTTVVVYCPEETQLQRLMQRNGLNRNEAEQRLRAQMPLEEKVRRADRVIDNSHSLEQTRQHVMEWLGAYSWDPYFVQH